MSESGGKSVNTAPVDVDSEKVVVVVLYGAPDNVG